MLRSTEALKTLGLDCDTQGLLQVPATCLHLPSPQKKHYMKRRSIVSDFAARRRLHYEYSLCAALQTL